MNGMIRACPDPTDHKFEDISRGGGYFKKKNDDPGIIGLGVYDHSVMYGTILCTKCGETREIILADHREKKNVGS